MTKDEILLQKRLIDLSRQAQTKDIVLFSDFLNLNEQNIFHQTIPELFCRFEMSGGYGLSERQMIAFLPDALCYAWEYPICCLQIKPKNQKFADKLTHRDVLGSIMNLGITREMLGDILVEEQQIYVFCQEKIAEYLEHEIFRIRHTAVSAARAEASEISIQPHVEPMEGIVTSNRLDSVIACMCKISRSQAGSLIKSGKVFINGRELTGVTYECKEQEIISVRSVGRFRYTGSFGETRKGRLKITYEKYV